MKKTELKTDGHVSNEMEIQTKNQKRKKLEMKKQSNSNEEYIL